MTKISIIDYGVGNLFSMSNALRKTNSEVKISKSVEEILAADGLVLPGVGNFGAATEKLEKIADSVKVAAINGAPILGSCLGMQLLFEQSEEAEGEGLGLVKGNIRKFNTGLKIPHMGWNTLIATRESPLLKEIPVDSYFYFVHSYFPEPKNPKDTLAHTVYGGKFTSIIEHDNIYGTQFHPEKSGKPGSTLLSNFVELIRR